MKREFVGDSTGGTCSALSKSLLLNFEQFAELLCSNYRNIFPGDKLGTKLDRFWGEMIIY